MMTKVEHRKIRSFTFENIDMPIKVTRTYLKIAEGCRSAISVE